MKRDKVIEKLENYLLVAKATVVPTAYGACQKPENSHIVIRGESEIVKRILDRVLPDWEDDYEPAPHLDPFEGYRRGATKAIAFLKNEQELADILGDSAPRLSAGAFHPWVWEAARPQWQSGHYRDAVSAAARLISNNTQAKVGRKDRSEWSLIQESFAIKPPEEGRPRLRFSEEDGGDTFKNLHEGAGHLAVGLYRAIRNPSNHDVLEELTEDAALEQLAAFSLLARWIDEAEVVRAE